MDSRSALTLFSARRFCFGLFTLLLPLAAWGYGWAEDGRASSSAAEPVQVACTYQPGTPMRKLSGVVADPTGTTVANAQLTLTCGDFRKTTTSDATGNYSFDVPAGNYQLLVEAANFGSANQKVTVNDAASGTVLNPELRLGQLNSAITVTAGNEFATAVSNGGTKTDLPLSEVPQAISVVNRDLMNSQEVVKLDDALKNVAGVMPGGY